MASSCCAPPTQWSFTSVIEDITSPKTPTETGSKLSHGPLYPPQSSRESVNSRSSPEIDSHGQKGPSGGATMEEEVVDGAETGDEAEVEVEEEDGVADEDEDEAEDEPGDEFGYQADREDLDDDRNGLNEEDINITDDKMDQDIIDYLGETCPGEGEGGDNIDAVEAQNGGTPPPYPPGSITLNHLDFEDFQPFQYELRKKPDKRVPTTLIDQDETGDYDPVADKALLRKANRGKKKRPKKEKTKVRVPKLIVRLPIKAFGTVRNITEDQDNWPDGHSDVSTDEAEEIKQKRWMYRQATPGLEPQVPISDPKGEFEDLTGRPSAAGCVSCRKYDQSCSILTTGQWPCKECEEDGQSDMCQLIYEPKVKRACDHCHVNGLHCDFQLDGRLRGPCSQCQVNGVHCTAKPAPGHELVRSAMDMLADYGPDRKHVTCTSCRQAKKRCSLKRRTDKPPCTSCKRDEVACTFLDPPKPSEPSKPLKKPRKSAKAASSGGQRSDNTPAQNSQTVITSFFSPEDLADLGDDEEDHSPREREPTPHLEMTDAEGHTGITTRIWTAYRHPIIFDTYAQDHTTCLFCTSPLFAFVGFYGLEVEVLQWDDGRGYTELGGGHAEAERSVRMCRNCTMSRVQIMLCGQHDIVPDPQHDPSASQYRTALLDLRKASGVRETCDQHGRWCTFCFSLAEYHCATQQTSLVTEPGKEESMVGCGLRLCGECHTRLFKEHHGDMDALVTAFERECTPYKTPSGKIERLKSSNKFSRRADVGFLRSDGLLARNMEYDTAKQAEQLQEMDIDG